MYRRGCNGGTRPLILGRQTILLFKLHKFSQLILRKIIKSVATRCQILWLECTKFDFGCYGAPLRGLLLKGKGEKGTEGRSGKEAEGWEVRRRKERERGGERREREGREEEESASTLLQFFRRPCIYTVQVRGGSKLPLLMSPILWRLILPHYTIYMNLKLRAHWRLKWRDYSRRFQRQ